MEEPSKRTRTMRHRRTGNLRCQVPSESTKFSLATHADEGQIEIREVWRFIKMTECRVCIKSKQIKDFRYGMGSVQLRKTSFQCEEISSEIICKYLGSTITDKQNDNEQEILITRLVMAIDVVVRFAEVL